jgi:Cell division protein CrgA
MPKSRIRKKDDRPAPTQKSVALGPSDGWVAPTMVGLFLAGLLWIVIYYVSSGDYPIPAISNWNLLVGFALITGGFITSTQWR